MAKAQDDNHSKYYDFANMSIEELMNIKVTSVSKKADPYQDIASSVYIISSMLFTLC